MKLIYDQARATNSEQWVKTHADAYPFHYSAPYNGYPNAAGNYLWIPDRATKTALYMFDNEEDRDAFASGFPKTSKVA